MLKSALFDFPDSSDSSRNFSNRFGPAKTMAALSISASMDGSYRKRWCGVRVCVFVCLYVCVRVCTSQSQVQKEPVGRSVKRTFQNLLRSNWSFSSGMKKVLILKPDSWASCKG